MKVITTSLTEAFYIGSTTYLLRFRNGIHEIVECDDFNEDNRKIIFSGHYEKCRAYLENLEVAYLESRF